MFSLREMLQDNRAYRFRWHDHLKKGRRRQNDGLLLHVRCLLTRRGEKERTREIPPRSSNNNEIVSP